MVDPRVYNKIYILVHPRHTKVNIPCNLARRLRTIISEDRILKIRMQELKSFLIKQNYPIPIIDNGFKREMSLDKGQLRMVKARKDEKIIPYVSTYNPKDPQMFRVIVDHLPILKEDVQMCDILSRYKIIKSKRQPYNLKRLLSKAKFVSNDKYEVLKCNRANCGLCIHLIKGSTISFKCGINFKVHKSMSCNVQNVMRCRGCGEEYIGETDNFLRKRVTVHNQQIRDPRTRMLKVSEHIDTCARGMNPKYFIFPFYKLYIESATFRRAKEKYFINTLKPKLNKSSKQDRCRQSIQRPETLLKYSESGNVIILSVKQKNLIFTHFPSFFTKCPRFIALRSIQILKIHIQNQWT